MQWYWWTTIILGCFYAICCTDLAWKATGQAAKELMAEECKGHQPVMTIEIAILYGEALLSQDKKTDQEQYYEEL